MSISLEAAESSERSPQAAEPPSLIKKNIMRYDKFTAESSSTENFHKQATFLFVVFIINNLQHFVVLFKLLLVMLT